MKNQDPTKPMDSTQYVAQLATFSQVEQSVQTNTKLDQIMQSSALSQADALIGRSITSADGKTTGTVASVRLASSGLIAVLQNGTEVAVGPGVSVKAASWAASGRASPMNEADALDIVQYAVWTVLTASAPVVLVAMAVGIGIALIQALTQIQEITLTFVPKIVAIMLVVALTGPFIGSQISAFTNVIFERIQNGF